MRKSPNSLGLCENQINKVFKKEKDRSKAHSNCSRILEDLSTDKQLLREILKSNIEKKDFVCQSHYPVLSFPICSNHEYELIANVWIPLASKSTNYSTKSIHHHGPMLLTTVTTFGPGYFHYLFDRPVKHNSDINIFNMAILEAKQHERSSSLFVDQYLPHCPMYPEKLSITYALWSNSVQTKVLSRIKKMPFLKRHASYLRDLGKKIGLTHALDLKLENYLDYYPIENNFSGVKNRNEVEFQKGPPIDRVQSILNLLQLTDNEDLITLCEKDIINSQLINNKIKTNCIDLISKANTGNAIDSKISDDLHFGFEKANFTHDQIKASSSMNSKNSVSVAN